MEKHYINHAEFADLLGVSKSTLSRRAKEIDFIFSNGLLSLEEREAFLQKRHEWEQKRIDDRHGKNK